MKKGSCLYIKAVDSRLAGELKSQTCFLNIVPDIFRYALLSGNHRLQRVTPRYFSDSGIYSPIGGYKESGEWMAWSTLLNVANNCLSENSTSACPSGRQYAIKPNPHGVLS